MSVAITRIQMICANLGPDVLHQSKSPPTLVIAHKFLPTSITASALPKPCPFSRTAGPRPLAPLFRLHAGRLSPTGAQFTVTALEVD